MTAQQRERVLHRVLILQLLLELYQRAIKERKFDAASDALRERRDMLRAMKEKRGYEG